MQLLMSLALRMGRTLAELCQTMTASELLLWVEYDRLEKQEPFVAVEHALLKAAK